MDCAPSASQCRIGGKREGHVQEDRQYDAIIIGSGQGGTPLASALAKAGRRTVLIERTHVGGTCINEGCTPTKTMIASGRVAYLVGRAADYGVRVGSMSVDMGKVRERKRAIVEDFRGGEQRGLEKTQNLDLLFGEGSFIAPKRVQVRKDGGEVLTLSAEIVVIDTGSRPLRPPVPG